MSTSSDPPGRSSSDSRHYPQRDLQYQYPQRSPNRRSTPSISSASSRFSESQQHHHRDHYNAPTPPIPLPLPLVAAPAPPSTTSSSSVSSWSSAGGLGGDRHTHRIMEPKPLRIPYGLSSGPASPSMFGRSASSYVGTSDSSAYATDHSRSQSTIPSNAERRQSISAPGHALPHQTNESPYFLSSSKAKLESILDESRSRLSVRTPSLENDPTPPILSNAIYERHLLKHRHGFPLWSPHPSVQLPKSYVDKGVRVGDVGIITQYGAFDYLFNICLPAEHPNNSGPLPDGFVPLLTQQKDISESPEHPPNSCFCSSVKQASHLSFESTASEGAILILPEGAHHEDIRNLSKFREYAAHHAHSWYKFANGVCGREIENGELHLVTGCDKTANWGMAAFSGDQVKSQGQENQSQQQEHQQLGSAATSPVVTLTFTTQVGPDGESPVYSWEKKNTSMYHGHPGHIHVEAKSSSSSTSQSPISATTTTTPSGSSSIGATPGTERSKNQCTFVRSHTISLSDDEWSKVMASINVGTAASGGGDSASDTSTIDLVAKRSRNTLKRFFSSFGPKSSNLLAKSPGGSTLMFPEFPSRIVHPATIINKVLLQKCPQARIAVTHDEDWALLSDAALQSVDANKIWAEISEKFDINIDPSGTAYLSVKDSKQKDAQIPDIRFKSPPLELFPFADAPLPGGLVESDFTIELLIEMITSPTAPTPSHIHLLSVLLSKQTPPRFSALQPVLYRLCSRRSNLTLQALGYEVMAAYWNNSKVKNASWPTTSDALSCLTFFLDPKSRWHLDLWEVRFKALAAVTKDGTDLRGIETVVIEVIKDCILNAFRLLINPPKGMPVPPPSECERCIVVVGRFLHELFAYRANIARIKDDVLESVFQFYADLIDDHIHLPLPQSQTVLSPTEVHAVPERSTRRGHKRRAPSLTSFMFLASPTPTAEQSHPLPTKSKHPAEIAISLFLGHVGTHLLNLSKKQFEQVLPLLFRSLAFCASPLPRLTVEPQVAGPKTLENRIVEILNTLVPSPMSNVALRILRKHLTPRHVGGAALPTAETPSGEKENGEEEGDKGNGAHTKTASAAVAQDNAKAIRSYTLMIMTSLGASRTLRNYIRRALTTRLEKAYQPQQVAGGKEATGRSSIDQDLLDVAWLKHDHGQGRPATESGETRVISSSIDAWVGWSPGLPDLGKGGSPQGDMWDRIMEGKENILEEMAGIVKDIYQEFDSREDGGVHVDVSELDHTNDALQSLAKYIFTLRSPDGSPFIINVFHPGESPTPLLRSITTLLSRDFHDSQKSLLADILIQGCEHVTDENTARIPVLMTDNYDLLPLTSTWLEHWKRLFDPRLLSVNRPHTRRTIIETLYEVYDSVRESQSYRKALAQLVMSEAGILIAAESSELVFSILEEEAILVISESDQLQETGAVGEHDPVQLLTSILFNDPDESTALHVARSLIHVFTEIAFKSLSFSTPIQEVAVTIFNTFLQALSQLSHPEPRVMILQFLMRWRADRDHRVYFALEGYDTNHSIAYMASLINRLPDSLMRAHKDEILEEHVARKRQHRSRTTFSRTPTSQGLLGRGRSQTVSEVKESKHHKTLWHLPETLPFKVPEPDTVKHGLRSFGEGVLLPISKYIAVLADLIDTDPSWEVVSYILVHLPVQLANKHLFCGPTTRTSIIKLLYVLSKGVIDGSLASQTADDCPEGLKLRDLQGLAHHTLSTLISYKTYFDLQQRQLLIEAFFSGLNGQFSTIKCCLHALALTAFEMSTSLSRSLPKILEKLAQIMSNPNMAVHILAFLVMVGSLPTLYASFTEEDFKMVFGVALQYLQHYNQLQESPTRSWALSQHVRQQSFVTLYTWFSVLKLRDREIHIPYITRQLLLANEGREGVDGLTQVCFDWLARNTHGIASAEKLKLQDVVLQPNIAKPERPALSKTWMFGNSFLTMRDLERPGWIEVVSRRPSGSAGLICRRDHFLEVMKDGGPPALKALFMDGQDNGGSDEPPPDEVSDTDSATDKDYEAELDPISFASHLFFHMSPLPETTPELTDVSDAPTLSKSLGLLDRTPVIDTHKVGIMYAGPGQTNEIEILANTHGSQAYSRFLDGIGRLVHLRTEKEVYTGSLDPEEDGEYAYAWWDDIRQILFHTATLMPNREHDPMFNYKKRHIGNDYVRIIWNDSGLPYAFDTLKTAFQFVNIIIEPHSVGTICAFSNDAHENEYFRVIVQTAEGMTECTPVGQFKIVSAVNLPHIVRHLCIFADCFTSIFSSTDHDTLRVEIKSNWNSRLDSMERFRKNVLSLQQQNSNDNGSTTSTSVHI